jgi:AraC-like DNA-binding protein
MKTLEELQIELTDARRNVQKLEEAVAEELAMENKRLLQAIEEINKNEIELPEIEVATPRPFKVFLFGKEQSEIWYSPKLVAERYNVGTSTVYRRLKMETINPILGIDFRYIR